MTAENNLEEKLKSLSNAIGSDDHLVENVMGRIETKTIKLRPSETFARRFIMNRFTKLAAAALIIIVAVISINLLDKAIPAAWAIEDTIAILRNFNGIHISGTMLDKEGKETSFEAWARANEDQTASNHLRLKATNGHITVVSKSTCYRYDPNINTVNIVEGYGPAMSPWLGAGFFESLKKMVLDWKETYGKDPATNRDRVFITCSHPAAPEPRSWWFECDVESKLPVSFKQWENMSRQGTPRFYAKSIKYFDDLPDELFNFEMPEGVRIVKGLPERMDKLQDPNAGMAIGNMTEEQACEEIVIRYWNAITEQDWQTVALLRPIATAEQWQYKYKGNHFVEEIEEIGKPYQEKGCKLGKVVPCTIRFYGNVTRTINMIVLFREIDGEKSCVIAGTWGSADKGTR